MKNHKILFIVVILSINLLITMKFNAQIINIDNGSYTKTFPGTDAAGRNGFPSGVPQLSGSALGKPVPTNDWWSKLVKEDHASNLFNYPYTLKTTNEGLVVSYIPFGVIDDQIPVVVGLSGLAATKTTVSNYTDWTVTMNWNDGNHHLEATSGIGMPFLYFTKSDSDIAQLKINIGTVTIQNEMLIIENTRNGADFAVYAPVGSTWVKNGSVYTSDLNGRNYWSMAFIPLTASNVTSIANEYKKYAYVFPVNTTVNYNYNESNAVLRTEFNVQTDVKEGTESNILLGLLPHQWANLASDSPIPDKYTYSTIRGLMKTLAGNSFSVENKFKGVLPTLPYVDNYSSGFSPTDLTEKIASIENDALELWTDSYNEGQVMNRLIQTARIAAEMGNSNALNKILATIKDRLENWLEAEVGEKAFLFYYNSTWSALLGYPAGHGQDTNINDHHFHWGYFIHAAAFLEQYEQGWSAKYGEMINLLVRDAASIDRNDPLFPFLRNFSPYAGHCWANGFADFPQGNDQESTSESMQFNSSLIHWGEITKNKAIRDLGIYLYTTEQTAIEEYWMDIHHRNFPPSQPYSLVSRIWGNSFDNGTFWTADIAASYGIEMYPIHGGSLYLGHDTTYVKELWNEIKANTGILSNQVNANLWHDVMWKYQAFVEPSEAIKLYNSYPDRSLKFGISEAHTYHWLHAMNALGRVDASVTADYPIAAAFRKGNDLIYVANNYSADTITVHFSTGFNLVVPPRKMTTSMDSNAKGLISSSFDRAALGGSVNLNLTVTEGIPAKVEFMDGETSLGVVNAAPFSINVQNLNLGVHRFYAKVFENDKFNTSNIENVIVGEHKPFNGTAYEIPGIIEAGKFDIFEGGKGQNITYLDLSPGNSGDFRLEESVDVSTNTSEGTVVGWINTGEWLEYTVNIQEEGAYSFAFRYSSGNANGGGPFWLELDGQRISENIVVPSTSTTSWTVWATKTVNDISLIKGKHLLRIVFSGGEFNLGKMTFTRTGALNKSFPTANAGENIKVLLPASSTQIDGSLSSESTMQALNYHWEQMYGPNKATLSDASNVKPTVTGLIEGMYEFRLTVKNTDSIQSIDYVQVLVSSLQNVPPTVSVTSPANNSTFTMGKGITLSAIANDYDGNISKVVFFEGSNIIAESTSEPYTAEWNPGVGTYNITAKATDNGAAETTSQSVTVNVDPSMICSSNSKDASQGAFTLGYNCTYETVGTNVTITFELLDDKAGVVAYLWKESPFSENQMTQIGDRKFTSTLGGLSPGTKISYACKFAYAGGMSVTKYILYEVGSNCDSIPNNTSITQAPAPLLLASDVISIFSDPFSNVASNFDMWYATDMNEITIATDKIKQVKSTASNAAFGTPTISPSINLITSNMQKLHVDIYPTVATSINMGVVTSTGECKLPLTLIPSQWNSIDLLLTDLKANNPASDLAAVKQVGFWLVNGNFYLDNLFFYKGEYLAQTALNDFHSEIRVSVYPNPVQDVLRITAENVIEQVTIRNLTGQIVTTLNLNSTEGQISLSNFASGNYIVSTRLSDGHINNQLIFKYD